MTKGKISLDLEEFKPEPKKIDPEAKSRVAEAAESAGFTGRHATVGKGAIANAPKTTPEQPVEAASDEMASGVRRRGRKRTTGRDTPFTVKLRRDTNNMIYELADRMECNAIAEVIEQALEALQEKLSYEEGQGS